MSAIRATSEHSLGGNGGGENGQKVRSGAGNTADGAKSTTATGGKTVSTQRSSRGSDDESGTVVSRRSAANKANGYNGEIAPGDVDVVVSFRKKLQSVKDLLDDL